MSTPLGDLSGLVALDLDIAAQDTDLQETQQEEVSMPSMPRLL